VLSAFVNKIFFLLTVIFPLSCVADDLLLFYRLAGRQLS